MRGRLKLDKTGVFFIIAFLGIVARALIPSYIDDYSVAKSVQIACNITVGASLILFALLNREKTSLLARIALIIEGLSQSVLPFAKDYKEYYLFFTIILWSCALLLCLSCIFPFGEKEGRMVAVVGATFTLLDFLSFMDDYYEFKENSGDIHFLVPSILITVAVTGVCIILLIKDKIPIKDKKNDTKAGKIAIVFLAIMASFALSWSIFYHLNFALDTSEPVKCEEKIIEKDTSGGKRTNYYFYVEIDGEERRIEVPRSIYRQYEEGDTLEIFLYDGAFDDPFYTYLN